MKLTPKQWERFIPTKTIFVEMQVKQLTLKQLDGTEIELVLDKRHENFVESEYRLGKVLKIPRSLGTFSLYGEEVPFPKDMVEIGDYVIVEHLNLIDALHLSTNAMNGQHIDVDGKLYPSIYPTEVSAVIKNGVMYGSSAFFIGIQLQECKSDIIELSPKPSNNLVVHALPYGYKGEVKVGDTVFMRTNNCYHIESALFRHFPEDYVRIFVDNVECIIR